MTTPLIDPNRLAPQMRIGLANLAIGRTVVLFLATIAAPIVADEATSRQETVDSGVASTTGMPNDIVGVIVLDENDWVADDGEPVSVSWKPPSGGPTIDVRHREDAIVSTDRFDVDVAIVPDDDGGVLIDALSLKVNARKYKFGRMWSRDITNDVRQVLNAQCEITPENHCSMLVASAEIRLSYGTGPYEFFIRVADVAGRMSETSFTVTRQAKDK